MRPALVHAAPILLAWLSAAPGVAQELPPCDLNLLLNPDCEEALVGGEIPHWTQVGANGWACRSASPSPASGAGYFAAADGDTTELFQDVDVSAYGSFTWAFRFAAAVRTGDEAPSDLAQVLFEFRGQGGVLGQLDFGAIESPSGWSYLFRCCEGPPPGTEVVRVRMIGIRRQGLQLDALFDSVEVFPICPLANEATAWGRIKALYRE